MKKTTGFIALLLSFLFLLFCASHSAYGVEYADKNVEELLVTADRIPQTRNLLTRAVTVIDKSEIMKYQYSNLSQILQKYGLVTMVRGNQPLDQIQIRGMKNLDQGNSIGGNILLMVDGRVAGSSFISSIPMIAIEKIEILRGSASVQYGSSAMGGVVNVITKRGGEKKDAYAEIGAGSWDAYRVGAGISGTLGIFDYSAGLTWHTQHSDYHTGKGVYSNTKMNHRTDYALNLGITPFDGHRLGMVLLGSATEKSGSPYYYDGVEMSTKTKYDYANRDTHSFDFVYDGSDADLMLDWRVRAFNTKDIYTFNSRNVEYDPLTFLPSKYADDYYTSRARERNDGVQAQISWKNQYIIASLGFDWLKNAYRANSGDPKAELNDRATYASIKGLLFDSFLVLSAGLRYDDYTIKYNHIKADDDKFTYSLGAAINPFGWMTIRSNFGTSFKMPAGMSVAGYTNAWGPDVLPNTDLKPEKGYGWDFGIDATINGMSASISYFQTNYKDQIYLNYQASQYQNRGGTSKYRGIEFHADADFGKILGFDFVLRPYVNMDYLIKSKDQFGHRINDVRDIQIAYGINFAKLDWGFSADLNLAYFGRQKETRWNDDYTSDILKTGGFTTIDLFISQRLFEWENAGKLALNCALTNLTDRHYCMKVRYPMQGRAFYLGLRYDY